MVAGWLVGLLALTSLAVAQPRVRINGREDEDFNRNIVRRNGHVMAPARGLWRQFGSDIERRGDWYYTRHGGHEYRFRPGSRTWYQDNRPLYFREAPYVHNGSLLLNILDLVAALGGSFDWDDRYQRGNIWYGPAPTGYGYGGYYPYPSGGYAPRPITLQVQFPKNYARVNPNRMNASGYGIPYGDVQILIYRVSRSGNQLVFDSGVRVNSAGQWSLSVPMAGPGTYRMVAQSLDEYGRVLGTKNLTLYAD
jgi:hypothetical protein